MHLAKIFLLASLLLLVGCAGGSLYVGDWQAVGGTGQGLSITHVRGLEYRVALAGAEGRPRVMTAFLISSGALEVGNSSDIFFQYLVADKDSGHLYLLQATDMRGLNPAVEGGRVSRGLVNNLQYVEFARAK